MVRPSTLLHFEPEFGPNPVGHPARFPLQLPTFFIKLLTQLGGTGTTALAVLAGLGWTRTADALGPVIRDTDGRVFTFATLSKMLLVQPFPGLAR